MKDKEVGGWTTPRDASRVSRFCFAMWMPLKVLVHALLYGCALSCDVENAPKENTPLLAGRQSSSAEEAGGSVAVNIEHDEKDADICAVCLTTLGEPRVPFLEYAARNWDQRDLPVLPVVTSCGHGFYGSCLLTNCRFGRSTCPACRRPLFPLPTVTTVHTDRTRFYSQFFTFLPYIVLLFKAYYLLIYVSHLPIHLPVLQESENLGPEIISLRFYIYWIYAIASWIPVLGLGSYIFFLKRATSFSFEHIAKSLDLANHAYMIILFLWSCLLLCYNVFSYGRKDSMLAVVYINTLVMLHLCFICMQGFWSFYLVLPMGLVLLVFFLLAGYCNPLPYLTDLVRLYADLWDFAAYLSLIAAVLLHLSIDRFVPDRHSSR